MCQRRLLSCTKFHSLYCGYVHTCEYKWMLYDNLIKLWGSSWCWVQKQQKIGEFLVTLKGKSTVAIFVRKNDSVPMRYNSSFTKYWSLTSPLLTSELVLYRSFFFLWREHGDLCRSYGGKLLEDALRIGLVQVNYWRMAPYWYIYKYIYSGITDGFCRL